MFLLKYDILFTSSNCELIINTSIIFNNLLQQVETELTIANMPVILSEELADDPLIISDWSTYNTEKLSQPKHPALVLPKGK